MTPLALDIAISLVIILSTVIAYLRGIIREIFTLLTLGVSFFIAYKGGHVLVPTFNQWLHVPDGNDTGKAQLVLGLLAPSLAAKVFSYGGFFLFFFIVLSLLGRLLTKWINEAGFAIVDRLLGSSFGFLRGFLLVFILYIPCTYLISSEKFPEWAKQSLSVPILHKVLAAANERFGLDKKIEDRGNAIVIKLDKIDLENLGEKTHPAEEELKKALKREELEIQKGAPDIQPDQLIDRIQNATPPDQHPPIPAPTPDYEQPLP